jgi:hypothetical protein
MMIELSRQESNEYWSQTPVRTSQRLYVAFCELASASLDYSEGVRNRLGAEPKDERSNWASTALYYSLVHSARLLVFLPFGDFPTRHDYLADCFQRDADRSVRTAWLNGFLHVRRELRHRRYSTEVTPANLYGYWRQTIQGQPGEVFLEWLGSLLSQAKALRNENNYEALLIAHEFNHVQMSDLFTQFTIEMFEGARRTLRTTALWFDQYLTATDGLPSGARLFIAEYIERRIVAPVRVWYGDEVAHEISDLMSPLLVGPFVQYSKEVCEINKAVDFEIFDPKALNECV